MLGTTRRAFDLNWVFLFVFHDSTVVDHKLSHNFSFAFFFLFFLKALPLKLCWLINYLTYLLLHFL